MATTAIELGERERAFLARLLEVAQADARFAAVAVVGSRVAGKSDAHSDLDLVFVVEDEPFEAFLVERDTILDSVGELLWADSWGRPDRWFFMFADGLDGDLSVVTVSGAAEAFTGPFAVVWDRRGVLANAVVSPAPPDGTDGRANLEQQLRGFWHEFDHLSKALARGQLWWAAGQLEVVRGMCLNLLRLSVNLDDPEVGDEPYWKVELSLPPEALQRLQPTFASFDRESMLKAARAAIELFGELGRGTASRHGLVYPEALEALGLKKLQ